jgi:BMFP domain-containing protein YqiC
MTYKFEPDRTVEDAIKNPSDTTLVEKYDAVAPAKGYDGTHLLAAITAETVARLEQRIEELERELADKQPRKRVFG